MACGVGAYVAPGTPVFTLLDVSFKRVKVEVDSRRLGRIKPRQAVTVTGRARPATSRPPGNSPRNRAPARRVPAATWSPLPMPRYPLQRHPARSYPERRHPPQRHPARGRIGNRKGMRKAMRRSSGTSALRSAMPCWMATAHSTALTTLGNSTSAPSPISLTIRPPYSATVGSKNSARWALSAASVPASSSLISRL
ncbi:MAG: HlyD family efflux transporter periplasmic adaptor subunit [Proteobacteria bacterium]|nr:HlyD family efflux transporter periplasmic adaptor subunit [Pseudomonadota bacterium]